MFTIQFVFLYYNLQVYLAQKRNYKPKSPKEAKSLKKKKKKKKSKKKCPNKNLVVTGTNKKKKKKKKAHKRAQITMWFAHAISKKKKKKNGMPMCGYGRIPSVLESHAITNICPPHSTDAE